MEEDEVSVALVVDVDIEPKLGPTVDTQLKNGGVIVVVGVVGVVGVAVVDGTPLHASATVEPLVVTMVMARGTEPSTARAQMIDGVGLLTSTIVLLDDIPGRTVGTNGSDSTITVWLVVLTFVVVGTTTFWAAALTNMRLITSVRLVLYLSNLKGNPPRPHH